MGKGAIIAPVGDGLYQMVIDVDISGVNDRIATLQSDLASLESEAIPALEAELSSAAVELVTATQELDAAILADVADDLDVATNAYISAMTEHRRASAAYNVAIGKKTALATEIKTIEKYLPKSSNLQVWCADRSVDLSGDVATIEIAGERKKILIRPGYNNRAIFNRQEHGQLVPIVACSPAATFYNLAMMPGWQRWMPTYRIASITDIFIENDTCSIVVESETSSVSGGTIDQNLVIHNVPIEYMTCNAEAFAEGDRVVVEFVGQDWNDPLVIGFADNPKPCGTAVDRCPSFFEIKISGSSIAPTEYYLILDSARRMIGFEDIDGTAPDGPCAENHIHDRNSYCDSLERPDQTDVYHVPVTIDGQKFVWDSYPRVSQVWSFCDRYPSHPLSDSGRPRSIAAFEQVVYADWAESLTEVNTFVNDNATYQSETGDNWNVMPLPGGVGDCEDFVLTKMQRLADIGFPVDAMDLIVCKLNGVGHAVVGVYTDQGMAYLEVNTVEPLFTHIITDDAPMTRVISPISFEPVECEPSAYIPQGTVNGEVIDTSTIQINKTPARFAYKSASGNVCGHVLFDTPYAASMVVQAYGSYITTGSCPYVEIHLNFSLLISKERSEGGFFHLPYEEEMYHAGPFSASCSGTDVLIGPAELRLNDISLVCQVHGMNSVGIDDSLQWPAWVYNMQMFVPKYHQYGVPMLVMSGHRHASWFEPALPFCPGGVTPWAKYVGYTITDPSSGVDYHVEPFAVRLLIPDDLNTVMQSLPGYNKLEES
jgi:hypothetical protein